jgi:hypothetical protein
VRVLYLAPLVWLGCAAPPADPCPEVAGDHAVDEYGGATYTTLPASGWFRVEQVCDRWWLVTPAGHPFYSAGVNSVGYGGNAGQESGRDLYREALDGLYDSPAQWAEVTVERLRAWGFTTIGSWSDHDLFATAMPFTVNLSLSGGDWLTGDVADYFDPTWSAAVEALALERAAPWADNPFLVGYFIDNEIRWGPDWRGDETLLQLYLTLDVTAAGKAVAVDTLLDELGDVAAVNSALGTGFADRDAMLAAVTGWDSLDAGNSETEAALTTAFLRRAATQYFRVTAAAIRATDPDHLVLGNREVSVMTRREIYEAAAAHVDVFSINNYDFVYGVDNAALTLSGGLDPADWFAALHELTGKPILITEFGFRALDSGLPNSWPPIYPTWETQQERAREFALYARGAQSTPWIIGYHWFRWVDQPAEGRFDGEDNNWGLVNEMDQPYTVLTDEMTTVNPEVWAGFRAPGSLQ